MSRSSQRTRLEQREYQAHNGKLPEISCLPELEKPVLSLNPADIGTSYVSLHPAPVPHLTNEDHYSATRSTFTHSQSIHSQLSEEQILPTLTSDCRYLDNKVLGKPLNSFPLEHSWKNAVIKMKKIKQEYTSAYGLRETSENTTMSSLTQGSERYLAISNPSPVVQKTKGATNSYPISTCINEDYSCLPPLDLLPSTSSQCLDGFYKSRRETWSWKLGSLKAPKVHGGAGEEAAERLKYNRCSGRISFPQRSILKPGKGYHFTDPVRGAPPHYIQRLSQLAALECETINQEKNRKVRWTKTHKTT